MNERQRSQICLAVLVLVPLFAWFFTAKLLYGIEKQGARDRVGGCRS